MLQNVTWLAVVAFHTAANELPEVRQVMNKIHRNIGFFGGTSRRDDVARAGYAWAPDPVLLQPVLELELFPP